MDGGNLHGHGPDATGCSVLREHLRDDDSRSRLDQGEVGKRLGEVAEVPAGRHVEFLGVQAKWRGDAQQALRWDLRGMINKRYPSSSSRLPDAVAAQGDTVHPLVAQIQRRAEHGVVGEPRVGVEGQASGEQPAVAAGDELKSRRVLPLLFHTISVSDGIAMGTEGMRASLPSRDWIADSVELVVQRE